MKKGLPHMRHLKAKLIIEGYDQKALALELGRSQTYITRRMTGLEDFTSTDIETIVKFLHIESVSEFLMIFFPKINLESQEKCVSIGNFKK